MPHYLYDKDHVRYELYQTHAGKNYNWLFLPGGPGADSRYFHSLIDSLDLPGNVWLIDLPGNGDNVQKESSYNYDHWIELFPGIIQQFENPILVGHSFGGMFPLIFPELENVLKGFIIFNSAPTLWFEEATRYAKQFDLPEFYDELQKYTLNPSQETFDAAIQACMPYYFPKETLEQGREILSRIPLPWKPARWWLDKVVQCNFSATWVPQQVPTLIFGAKYDCMCPFTLFKNDERFHRENVEMLYLENAGHFPWLESPEIVQEALHAFCLKLQDPVEAK